MPPLSILIWLPAALRRCSARCCRPAHRARRRRRRRPAATCAAVEPAGVLALLGSLAALGLAIGYIADYNAGAAGLQHVTDVVWIPSLGIHYKLGVTGLNVFLVGADDAAVRGRRARQRTCAQLGRRSARASSTSSFMLAESAVLGAFLAQDLALFVAFFDLMLIPFYFLIGGWGRDPGARRACGRRSKLVIYTLVGSLLMLAGGVATGVLAAQQSGGHITSRSPRCSTRRSAAGTQEWIFLLFAAAFLVKMPAFPLHGWMPDGYRAMPIEVLMVFSGVLSKVGAYGFLAIVLPLFPRRRGALPDADAADRARSRSSTARCWPSRRPTRA